MVDQEGGPIGRLIFIYDWLITVKTETLARYTFFADFFASSSGINQFLQFHHPGPPTMVSETHKASNAPQKHHPTTKTHENNEITSKPPAKHVKSKGFIDPNKMSKEPMPESHSSTPEVIEQSLDVSELQYTVIWVCMLGSVSVEGDTDLYKLSEFNYREFNHLMVKKVTQMIEKSKIDFEWKSGSAALTFKGMSKANAIPIEVQDEEGWKKVEKLVEKAVTGL